MISARFVWSCVECCCQGLWLNVMPHVFPHIDLEKLEGRGNQPRGGRGPWAALRFVILSSLTDLLRHRSRGRPTPQPPVRPTISIFCFPAVFWWSKITKKWNVKFLFSWSSLARPKCRKKVRKIVSDDPGDTFCNISVRPCLCCLICCGQRLPKIIYWCWVGSNGG